MVKNSSQVKYFLVDLVYIASEKSMGCRELCRGPTVLQMDLRSLAVAVDEAEPPSGWVALTLLRRDSPPKLVSC